MKSDIDKSIQERVIREAQAHDNNNVLEESYRLKNRFHHIWSYPSRKRLEGQLDSLLGQLDGKDVLDYGCGWGESALRYYRDGADVTGIDVSKRFIDAARQRFQDEDCDEARYRFTQMDAHDLRFDDESFDIVIGDGILHHLEAAKALTELYRVLKPGGRVLLFEPLAGHPLLKLFRVLTPAARTVDERPLTASDLAMYSALFSWKVEHAYCGVIEAPTAMLTSLLLPKHPDNIILDAADVVERWLLSKRWLLSWNQYVLLNFKK